MFASFLAGLIEITLCYCWSNGILNYSPDLNWKVVVAGSLVTFWRSTHFYSMHRIMHPWRINGVPDIGKWLYRHVHSLHHKSFNPTAFSGTSMHPVEVIIFICFIIATLIVIMAISRFPGIGYSDHMQIN